MRQESGESTLRVMETPHNMEIVGEDILVRDPSPRHTKHLGLSFCGAGTPCLVVLKGTPRWNRCRFEGGTAKRKQTQSNIHRLFFAFGFPGPSHFFPRKARVLGFGLGSFEALVESLPGSRPASTYLLSPGLSGISTEAHFNGHI